MSNINAAAKCKDIADFKKEIDKLKIVELHALFMQNLKESILDLKSFIISCNMKPVDTGVGLIADFDSFASTKNSSIAIVATEILEQSNHKGLFLAIHKDILPTFQQSNVVYKYMCHCNSQYVG